MLFVANDNIGSATLTVVDETSVVVPATVKLPAIVTLVGNPTVRVLPDIDVSISFDVPAIVSVSESKSIAPVPESPAISKS